MATSDFIIPTIFENPLTKAVFTTRRGGFSKAPYNELNLGDHVKDDLNAVLKNREIVLKECGFKAIAWMNQTHSTKVCKVTMADTSSKIDADAIVTNEPGLGLAVMTADCLPVILADEDGRISKVVIVILKIPALLVIAPNDGGIKELVIVLDVVFLITGFSDVAGIIDGLDLGHFL